MADWRDAVFRISSKLDKRTFGTAFVCGREGAQTYMLTCHHVLNEIGEDNATVSGLPVRIIETGDDTLDLVLISVQGLHESPILALRKSADHRTSVEVFGHTWANPADRSSGRTLARRLSGTLGEDTRLESDEGLRVSAWDLAVDRVNEFAELLEGYSGSPVRDTNTGQVVAVVSHRRGTHMGYAIEVNNLLSIYPDSKKFFVTGGSHRLDSSNQGNGEYATQTDWVVKTIDHTEQIGPARSGITTSDRAYFGFQASVEDYPKALADHLYVELGANPDYSGRLAIGLRLTHQGDNAYWNSLINKISPAHQWADLTQQQQELLNWINARQVTVLYTVIPASCNQKQVPKLVEDACRALDALPAFAPGSKLLALFACLEGSGLVARCRRLFNGITWWRAQLPCSRLPASRKLTIDDTEEWLTGFNEEQERRYNKDRLRTGFEALFKRKSELHYSAVRRYLIDDGALRGAQRKSRI